MFALAWGDGPTPAGADETWRGVHEPQRWVCRAGHDDTSIGDAGWQAFDTIGSWNPEASASAAVANFVIRIVTAEAHGSIRSQLVDQANAGDGVLSRPGCLGLMLAAAVGQPETMLGVSFWPSVEDFDAYAAWAQTAAWKDVITPVTVGVPLRLLGARFTLEKETR